MPLSATHQRANGHAPSVLSLTSLSARAQCGTQTSFAPQAAARITWHCMCERCTCLRSRILQHSLFIPHMYFHDGLRPHNSWLRHKSAKCQKQQSSGSALGCLPVRAPPASLKNNGSTRQNEFRLLRVAGRATAPDVEHCWLCHCNVHCD